MFWIEIGDEEFKGLEDQRDVKPLIVSAARADTVKSMHLGSEISEDAEAGSEVPLMKGIFGDIVGAVADVAIDLVADGAHIVVDEIKKL